MDKRHTHIVVRGIVQGVGFRPFVFRLANTYQLRGIVCNSTDGVHIEVEGEYPNVESFIEHLRTTPPPLAIIKKIEINEGECRGYEDFRIIESVAAASRNVFVSPDIALCDDCRQELLNPSDIRYHYPFITCTNCGPRFSIVEDIPYDRHNTSMKKFPLCHSCLAEYKNPFDRRFHAQPNACSTCGPHLELYDATGQLICNHTDEIIHSVVRAIVHGKIIAIKLIGGFCIVCDAENDTVVRALRLRKMRPFKPFALMAGSIDVIEQNAQVSALERTLLVSHARPIVLLKAKKSSIASSVAPGLSYYG
ncbi:MAG: acylphosphatase, partial [Spirochaetes bacterium]|nr:acylphosphatase [Spirochaetota bacterium]